MGARGGRRGMARGKRGRRRKAMTTILFDSYWIIMDIRLWQKIESFKTLTIVDFLSTFIVF
jgi:hypothetical protein